MTRRKFHPMFIPVTILGIIGLAAIYLTPFIVISALMGVSTKIGALIGLGVGLGIYASWSLKRNALFDMKDGDNTVPFSSSNKLCKFADKQGKAPECYMRSESSSENEGLDQAPSKKLKK